MSTHKHFDKICCVVLALTILFAILFVNGESFGIKKSSSVMKYESTLFDNSRVHTIDIIMDDWEEFTDNARTEEYYTCSVVIDGEAFKNVAIRGKGNTSLSSVNNGRYSYKIEFDHYDGTSTYHGLDKLVLNNVIQDNTYMKDYLTYTMMNDMGVAAPLCSYAYITVNGEDWGLYLAVESVEESFLQRNYGKDYGELYKPDSMSMGGGRGNGDKFDMNDFMQDFDKNSAETTTRSDVTTTLPATEPETEQTTQPTTGTTAVSPESTAPAYPEMPGGMAPPEGDPPFGGSMPEGSAPPVTGVSKTNSDSSAGNSTRGGMFGGMTPPDGADFFGGGMPDMNSMPSMGDFDISEEAVREAFRKLGIDESLLDGVDFDNISIKTVMTLMSKLDEETIQKLMQELIGSGASGMPSFGGDFGGNMPGGFGGMGSTDVKLQYIDDNPDSYTNIFGNAKTDITNADKARLIESLKKLSNGEELTDTVDTEAVIRYFVVHNFVVNSDSYTGAMIHNYYLYEKDGQMQMIPWDYNLAFGSFMSMGSATSSVNDPVDTPLSVSGSGDRPMIDWILSNEEYTEIYHKIFGEFIEKYFDSGYFAEMIDNTRSMISSYIEKDPTKFCTYGEFEKGISALKDFCLLRAESVKGQLEGTIGKTSSAQKAETLIDASHINTSDMGSMGMGGKGGFDSNMQKPPSSSDSGSKNDTSAERPTGEGGNTDNQNSNNSSRPQMPGDFGGGTPPESDAGENGQAQRPDSSSRPDGSQSQFQPQNMISASSLGMIGLSILVLGFGIIFAVKFKRRKYK